MNDKFTEIADWGDRKFYVRDFNSVYFDEENEKEIHLVLVAEIMDYYDATGDDGFEKEPYGISINIMPTLEHIDKKHIEAASEDNDIKIEYTDIVTYMGGVPVLLDDLNKQYETLEEAEEYLLSEELRKKLNAISIMIGFYLDGAINRIGQSRWSFLEYMIDSNKKFY